MEEMCRIVRFVVDLGADIIRCGGEVSRAEESVTRICSAYGAKRVTVFAINSYISVCVECIDGESRMVSKRIRGRETDLGRLERLNCISRGICNGKITISEAEKQFAELGSRRSPVATYITSMLVCLVFTLYFDGGLREALASGAAAFVTVWLKRRVKNGFGNAMVLTFVCSVACGTVGAILVSLGIASDYSVIAKGDIMLLVPGVSIVCAGRDVICGEILTGVLGFIETILIAVALAVGFALPELILMLAAG